MTIEEMQKRKRELGYTIEQIAHLAGLPAATVQKIFQGTTKSPRYKTIQALEKVLSKEKDFGDGQPERISKADMVMERPLRYGEHSEAKMRNDGKTLTDYYALPDERRVELIDGIFYDMSAPTTIHQEILLEISIQLRRFVSFNNGACRVLPAPVDVQLDKDDKTMVQPDIVVICDHTKLNRKCCIGAPDLVVEILSRSTAKNDLTLKTMKYSDAGVREYWIVDPESRHIIVYDMTSGEPAFPAMYGFDAQVPVRIWDGECKVDFQRINEQLSIYDDM